jgi:hypothetical protein
MNFEEIYQEKNHHIDIDFDLWSLIGSEDETILRRLIELISEKQRSLEKLSQCIDELCELVPDNKQVEKDILVEDVEDDLT